MPYCFSRSFIKFQGHTGWLIDDLNPIWVRLLGRSQLSNPSELPCSRPSVKFQGHTGQKFPILTYIGHFRTVTPVWIHPWLWNEAQSLKQHRIGALSIFEVIRKLLKFQCHLGQKIAHFDPNWAVTARIHWWEWNDAQNLIWYKRGALLFFGVIHQISRSHGLKNWQYESYLSNIIRPVAAIKSLRFALFMLLYFLFLAATKQFYEWYFPSVRLSVTPFWVCSHHRIIIKFLECKTKNQGKVHAKGQGQRSRSQKSQPNLTVSGL